MNDKTIIKFGFRIIYIYIYIQEKMRVPLFSLDISYYIDILVCSIAVYFYETCSILASPKGESKYK